MQGKCQCIGSDKSSIEDDIQYKTLHSNQTKSPFKRKVQVKPAVKKVVFVTIYVHILLLKYLAVNGTMGNEVQKLNSYLLLPKCKFAK